MVSWSLRALFGASWFNMPNWDIAQNLDPSATGTQLFESDILMAELEGTEA